MRRLLILRHAKAEPAKPGGRDLDRSLAAIGREDAAKIGHYMLLHAAIPDLALVSTAARARETWALAAEAFPAVPLAVFEQRIYEADPHALLAVVRETDRAIGTLLMVGHNPGLHELAVLLIASGDLEARQRLNEGLPTAGLAVIDFARDDWGLLHPHAGRLERFIEPRMLAAATD